MVPELSRVPAPSMVAAAKSMVTAAGRVVLEKKTLVPLKLSTPPEMVPLS